MLPVKFSDFLQRKIRRGLLIEINPYQILVAGISRLDASPAVLDCAAEFDREDEAGLRQWLGENFDQKKGGFPQSAASAPLTSYSNERVCSHASWWNRATSPLSLKNNSKMKILSSGNC